MKHDETRRGYSLIGVLGITVLALLMLVTITSAAPYAYITNFGSDNVSVIDTATDTVTATIPVGDGPQGVAVNPSGTKVYVTNCYSYNVSVIDIATNKVIATIPVSPNPPAVAVSPDGKKVYVTGGGINVSVISTITNTITDVVPAGAQVDEIAVSPDGTKVYVSNQGGRSISVIDTAINKVTATVPVGLWPDGIVVSPDGKKVYVAISGDDNVSVIDTATDTVIATVPVRGEPHGVAVSPDGTKVYVANTGNLTVSVIDTATNTVTGTLNVGNSPRGIAVSPDGKKVYATTYEASIVSVIDTATNTFIKVPVGSRCYGIAVGPALKPIIPVANFTSNVTQGYAPLSVQFTDLSDDSTSRNWDFENDGIIDSIEEAPIHVYTNPGTYTVNLTAINENGIDSKTTTINVLPAPLKNPTITWNNPADITSGTALGSEQLNAIANDPNTGSSVTGTFTYNPEEGAVLDVGTHTLHVDFVPTDTATYNNASADVQINVLPVTLKNPTIIWDNPANITVGTALGNTQLNAVAKDPVTGAIVEGIYVYDPVASTQLPVGNGQKLHVNFMPTDTATYNTAAADVTINVLEKLVAPVANFSAFPTTGKASLAVTFTDKSAGAPTSWSWNFGDKSTSTDQSPVHTYNKAGKYTVSLTVKNELGSNTRKITNYIIVKK